MKKTLSAFLKAVFIGLCHGAVILCLLLVLAFAGLFWRLQYAPIEVGFLEPSINKSFSENNLGLNIQIKSAKLVWSEIKYPLSIVLDDIVVVDNNQVKVAKIDEALFSLSFEALLFGKIKASRLIVEHPNFYIVKDKSGKILVDFAAAQAPEAEAEVVVDEDTHELSEGKINQIMAILSSKEDVDNFFGKLDIFRLNNAKVAFVDLKNKNVIEAPDLNIELARTIGGFMGSFNTEVISKNLQTRLSGNFEHHAKVQNQEEVKSETFVSTSITDVNLKALLKDIGFHDDKSSYDGLITSSLKFSFRDDLTLTYVNFNTEIKGAKFMHADITDNKTIGFDTIKLDGSFDETTNLIKLDTFEIKSPDLKLSAEAEWDIAKKDNNIEALVTLGFVNVKTIRELWFEDLAPNPREWIMENLLAGDATNGKLTVLGGMEYGNKDSFTVDKVDGSFDFENFKMSYLPGFPIVENGKGSAKASLDTLIFNVESGTTADMAFGKSLVTLYDFDQPYERINIQVNDIQGPALTVAKAINNYPLHYIDKINQNPEHFSGTAKGGIVLDFPLDKNLEVEAVDFKGDISLHGFGLEKAAIEKNLTDAELTLNVNTKELHAKGSGKFDGVSLPYLEWNEYFTDASKLGTQIRTNFTTGVDKVKDLGVDLAPYFSGNVSSKFEYNSYTGDTEEINLDVDLKDTIVDFTSVFKFKKDVGVPAESKVKVNMKSGKIETIDVLSATSSAIKLDTKGQITLGKDFNISKIDFPSIIAADNNFSALITEDAFETITVKGEQINLSTFFKPEKGTGEKKQKTKEEKAKEKPLKLSLDVKKTIMPEGIIFKNVKASLEENKSKVLKDINFDALTPNGTFTARYGIHPETKVRRLYVNATNAAEALVGLGIAEKLQGGKLNIKAIADEKSEMTNTVKGKLLIKDMTVIKAPTLARLMNALSFDGVRQLFDGQSGLKFDRIGSTIEWENGIDTSLLRFRDGKTRSASLGLTFEGLVDIENSTIDMHGTIVPVSNINNFVANIPLIGDILTLGARDAIFAATYSVKGPTEESKVSVNPLSALAPGFLRKLFFEQDFKDSEAQDYN